MLGTLTAVVAAVPAFAMAQVAQVVPNGSLSVAYRQLSDGSLSESVHQLELSCWDGDCHLTTLTLNQCMESSQGPAFYPKVQRSSTTDRDLTVRATSADVVEVTQELSGTSFTYRFTFTTREDAEMAERFRLRSTSFFRRLVDFSGAAVRSSDILGKVVSWELVPLKGTSVVVEAKCGILLDGVPE